MDDSNYASSLDFSAFGHTLLSQVKPFISNAQNYWEYPFLVLNDDDSQNVVEFSLSFETTFTNPPLYIEISVKSISQVLQGTECVESCEDRTGFSVGLDPTTTPFSCLYCDTSLF